MQTVLHFASIRNYYNQPIRDRKSHQLLYFISYEFN